MSIPIWIQRHKDEESTEFCLWEFQLSDVAWGDRLYVRYITPAYAKRENVDISSKKHKVYFYRYTIHRGSPWYGYDVKGLNGEDFFYEKENAFYAVVEIYKRELITKVHEVTQVVFPT